MKKIMGISVLLCLLMVLTLPLSAKGKIEFGFHFSSWSINWLESMVEDMIADGIKTNMVDKIKEDNPEWQETSYTNVVDFDSGGNNFGFEFRWYPGGEEGSFSLGLSVEKTTMKLSLPSLATSLVLENELGETGSFQADANGEFLIKPLSFHLSFRWDIKPSWRVRPYITLGFGFAGGSALDNASLTYSFIGTLLNPDGSSEIIEESASKTLAQLKKEDEERKKEEGDEGEPMTYPGFLPFIQLSFGVKGMITKNVYLLVDYGIWNGFLLRGGISIRI
ncbi:MAG: hypothetical protein WCC06_09540 [Candidatus Aminicenantales bacterium]